MKTAIGFVVGIMLTVAVLTAVPEWGVTAKSIDPTPETLEARLIQIPDGCVLIHAQGSVMGRFPDAATAERWGKQSGRFVKVTGLHSGDRFFIVSIERTQDQPTVGAVFAAVEEDAPEIFAEATRIPEYRK